MSYLAIARKYRPSTFDEIVGQEHVTRTLRNAIEAGRVHHALLFTGARGVGKTTAARALARALNCDQGPTTTPCGACTSCKEITQGSSPDLIEIDGASNNSVDDIRGLRETVYYAPTRGQYRIYLIDEVHMLSTAAFNALLKTLEEPPPHVLFLFATTEPNKILDTILSRVQRFDFKRIPVPAVVQRLREITAAEGAELSDNALRMIARAGEGSMRDAQSLLDKVISFGGSESLDDQAVAETLGLIDRGLLYAMLQGLVEGDPARCLDAIAQVYSYGHELTVFTSELLEVLRNATFIRLSEEARRHVDLSGAELEQLEALVDGVEPEVLSRTFTALLEVHDQVARADRPRVVLEMAVARLATTRPVQPVQALLSRLEDLERRLRHGGASAPPSGMRRAGRSEGRRSHHPGSSAPRSPRPLRSRGPSPPDDDDGAPRASVQAEAPQPVAAPPQAQPEENRPPEPAPSQWAAPPPADPRPSAAPDDPWRAWVQRLQALGEDARRLATAEPELIDGVLRLTLPAGPSLARGRKALTDERVAQALADCYPPGTTLEVVAKPGTGTASDQQAALRRQIEEDPACQRIIDALGAVLEEVHRLEPDPGPHTEREDR